MSKGLSCILVRSSNTKGEGWTGANTPVACVLPRRVRAAVVLLTSVACYLLPEAGSRLMGSSDEVHVVDALAITGDEGRDSLR